MVGSDMESTIEDYLEERKETRELATWNMITRDSVDVVHLPELDENTWELHASSLRTTGG